MGNQKIRHMVEAAHQPTIVFTDHSAAISIVRQTSLNTVSTEKLNLRLIRASEYLQRFRFDVRYKPGKTNTVPDALSRLATREYRPEPTTEVASAHGVVDCYPVALLELSNEFKQRVIEGYQRGPFKRIIDTLKLEGESASPVKLPYRLRDGLLYLNVFGVPL